MANVSSGNSLYIDSVGAANSQKNTIVKFITVTATGGNGTVSFENNNGDERALKITLAVPHHNTLTVALDTSPLVFPDGVYVSAITNCVATLILTKTGGS